MRSSRTIMGKDYAQFAPDMDDDIGAGDCARHNTFVPVLLSLLLHVTLFLVVMRIPNNEQEYGGKATNLNIQLRLVPAGLVAQQQEAVIVIDDAVSLEARSGESVEIDAKSVVSQSTDDVEIGTIENTLSLPKSSMQFNVEGGLGVVESPRIEPQSITRAIRNLPDISLRCQGIAETWSLFDDCDLASKRQDYSALDSNLVRDFFTEKAAAARNVDGSDLDNVFGNFTSVGNTDRLMHMINSRDRVYRMSNRVLGYP